MKKHLQTSPAKSIILQIKNFVNASPDNRLSFMNNYVIFHEPLVKFADGDDPIFTEYKTVIASTHLTPREALARAYNKRAENIGSHISVISWILPIVEETKKSNRIETKIPSRLWCHTRWYGEKLNDKLRKYTVKLLTDMGYLAVAPMLQPYFKLYSNDKGPYSNWSERHIAYAAGQGTFSLSDGFIAECGIAHRCGSVVTTLRLPANRRIAKDHYSNCLFYAGVECRSCINRCPAKAITKKGHDKNKCQQYLHDMGYDLELRGENYDVNTSIAGCGLCQTNVPCEFKNPTEKLKSKQK